MKKYISCYFPSYIVAILYMLQSTEYSLVRFWAWWMRAETFSKIEKRRTLELTRRTKILLLGTQIFVVIYLVVAFLIAFIARSSNNLLPLIISLIMIIFFPLLLPLALSLPLYAVRIFYVQPKQKREIANAHHIFTSHPGKIIAVAGSYGKTTMKELLASVLSTKFTVAATPGNKNVAISHARFAKKLTKQEQFVIVEFGEGRKKDVENFTANVDPDFGIITGIAPNHLDEYGNLLDLQMDLLSLIAHTGPAHSFINGDNGQLKQAAVGQAEAYSANEVLGWQITEPKIAIDGTSFVMKKQSQSMQIQSQLIGRHQIATLAFVAAFAELLGMSKQEIEAAMHKTKAFEHRMEVKHFDGAWVIDDAYNGNIEGMKAGLAFMSEISATGKKVYVTPGLVEQGEETERVHHELGLAIATSKPDVVVLMKNSAEPYIQKGLSDGQFNGQIKVVTDPILFYTNLSHTLAAGDVVMLQNDWTDNYA